jgi:AraC-like DNA-binding protein
VDVFSTGFRMDHGWWDCTPGDVLAVEIDPERVHTALGEETEGIDMTTRLAVRDPVLEALCTCMRREVDSGCASGRLFAEGLSLALLARLRECYGARPARREGASRKLSTRQLHDAIDFIDANLGADLSLAALARQVSMSPSTFARLFKASVGATAHSFVLSRRLQRAEILLNSDASLSEIALAVGLREPVALHRGVPAPHRPHALAGAPADRCDAACARALLAGVAGRAVDRAGARVGRLLRIRAEQLARARVGRLQRDRRRRGAVLDPVGHRREQLPGAGSGTELAFAAGLTPAVPCCVPTARAVAHPGDHEQAGRRPASWRSRRRCWRPGCSS